VNRVIRKKTKTGGVLKNFKGGDMQVSVPFGRGGLQRYAGIALSTEKKRSESGHVLIPVGKGSVGGSNMQYQEAN